MMESIIVEGMIKPQKIGDPAIVFFNGQWHRTSPVVQMVTAGSMIMIRTKNHIYQTAATMKGGHYA